jgi:hypothetical protein
MAKQLKNIFNAGTDEIQQSFIINAAHVSQSTDAFTGVDDYSIAISGTFQMVDGVATFATGDYLSGGGIVFSGQSGSVSSPPLALYVSDDLQTANILADKQKLFIRNGNQSDGRGNVVIQVDQPGTSSTDIFEIAVFGSESLGTQLYHTGSLVFYTDSGSSGLGIVSTGYISGSKAYLPGTDNLEQNYVVGFDSTTGELTYFSTSSISGGGSGSIDTGSFMITGSVSGDTLTFEKGNGDTFDLIVSTSGSSMVAGGGCTRYDIVLSTDTGSTPSSGQAIFISGSVYGDNDTYGVIRIHEEDANGDNVNNFLGTTFESKQFNIHWVSSSLITTETNSSGQRFNQSVTIVTDISCSTEPAPGDPGDSGSIDPPPYVSPSSSGVGPISMVYSETLQGLKTGGTAVSLVDIYLDPLFVYADLSDTGSSAVFQTQVFRRDNLAFATEYTSESIMAYANTYLNSSQFNFDSSIYDGTQTPYLYRTASMSSEAPVGYYIFESEYTDVNLLKNAAKYEGSGSFDSKFPGWNYTPPAPTPPADPTTITKCTITTQTLAVSKSGDYWEIPWELDAYSGSYAPTSFSSSYMCFDADGSYSTLGGSEGIGGSGGGSTGATETLTALGYDNSTKLLAYVDEELSINIRDLSSITVDTGSLMVTGSVDGNVLTFEKGDGSTFDLTVTTGSGATDTGSLMITGSVLGNVLTFTKGDTSTFDLTVDTGSGATDTGSLLTTASISDATITFTKGDGSTFDIEVNNVTSSISSSYVANAFYSGSVHGNILTFTQFDGDQSVLTVDTGSSLASGSVGNLQQVTDSGSITTNSITASAYFGSHSRFVPLTNGAAPSYQEGLIYYNSEDGALTVFNDEADISLQVGQEFWVRAFNSGSVTITNGTPVRISGSHGDRPVIYPAVAENHVTESFDRENHIIGVATHDIEAKSEGYITAQGIVRGVNTSGFSAGDTLYLQTGSAGLRNTPPPFPYDVARVGYVTKVNNPNGFIFVEPKSPTDLADISQVSGSVLTANIGDLLVRNTNGSMTYTKTLSGSYTIDNGGLTADSFTGSLLGTASWAENAVSSSYAITASYALNATSASYAVSSSYALNATSASYAPNLYNTDGTLTDARSVTANGNSLTFEMTTADFAINSDPSQSIIFNDLPTQDNPQVLGIDASGIIKAMNTSSIAGDTIDTGSLLITGSVSSNIITLEKGNGSTFDLTIDTGSNSIPDTPLNSFQFNSSSEFGGSEMYYDEATQRVGININTPQADLHVRGANNGTGSILLETDSVGEEEQAFAAMYFRVADNDGANYKKFAVIAENTGSAFGVGKLHLALNSNAGSVGNATIADSKLTIDHTGSVFMPDIDTASQAYIIGYDSASGELTYFSTASFGSSIDTGSFYISSSMISGNQIRFYQGDGTNENVTISVNPGGVYDVDTRSSGTSQFSTTLETIIGSTTIPSGSTTQSVRISEIANLSLGNQVHITATLYGDEGTYGNKQYMFLKMVVETHSQAPLMPLVI